MTNLCGTCTMCCKIMGVKELEKPKNKWCFHCDIGVGCKIYELRPQNCQDFTCLWLSMSKENPSLDIELRPDKSKVVFTTANDGKNLNGHIDPDYPNAWRKGKMRKLISKMVQRSPVIITDGKSTKVIQSFNEKIIVRDVIMSKPIDEVERVVKYVQTVYEAEEY